MLNAMPIMGNAVVPKYWTGARVLAAADHRAFLLMLYVPLSAQASASNLPSSVQVHMVQIAANNIAATMKLPDADHSGLIIT